MIKKQMLLGPSCLTDAADDEPLFVLRANDELAPEVLRYWAVNYLEQKMRYMGSAGITLRHISKFQDAIKTADAMEKWDRLRKEKRAARRTSLSNEDAGPSRNYVNQE